MDHPLSRLPNRLPFLPITVHTESRRSSTSGPVGPHPGSASVALWHGLLALGLLLPCCAAVQAEPPAQTEASQKRADLDELKQRLEAMQQALAATESSQAAEARALADTERAVSVARRQTRETAAEKARIEAAMLALSERMRLLETRLGEGRRHFAAWLREAYVHQSLASAIPVLGADGESALTRDAYYLERLGRARLAVAERLRNDLAEQARAGEELSTRRQQLTELELRVQKEQAELEEALSKRQGALAVLAQKARDQKKAVEELRDDEKRLARVIDELARLARKQAAEAAARAAAEAAARARAEKAAREQAAAAARSASAASTAQAESGVREIRRTEPVEPVRGSAQVAAAPTPTGVRFSQLQGRLGFPVRGELVGRFGAARAGGGTAWRGVFIRAANGAEVKAVAPGQVVFSDWLRGFGNLIIVDHGDDYLTIYGNNDALLKTVGQSVAGGEVLASVGASGSEQETGLYFEIRHQGRPVDPQRWMRN